MRKIKDCGENEFTINFATYYRCEIERLILDEERLKTERWYKPAVLFSYTCTYLDGSKSLKRCCGLLNRRDFISVAERCLKNKKDVYIHCFWYPQYFPWEQKVDGYLEYLCCGFIEIE